MSQRQPFPFHLTREPIPLQDVLAAVERPEAGAVLLFVGTVREWTDGKRTVAINYEGYEPMALKELKRIGDAVTAQWPDARVAITHRLGDLRIGEASVAIAVSSPHRAEVYPASRFAIEQLKRTVPIWKKERNEDGEEWVEGCHTSETAWLDEGDPAAHGAGRPVVAGGGAGAEGHVAHRPRRWGDDERYARQIRYAPIGASGQQRLKRARVAIVGAGALGGSVANQLARAGAGFLRLIDRDVVDVTNLQRQELFEERDAALSLPKVVAGKEQLERINSDVEVDARAADLNGRNAEELLGDVDLIVDGTDNFATRYLINEVSVKRGIPWIYGGIVADVGETCTFLPGDGPCFACLYPAAPGPGQTPTCDTAGIIAPVVQLVAAHQAVEALKFLSGAGADRLRRSLLHVEMWSGVHREVRLPPNRPDCPVCKKGEYRRLNGAERDSAVLLCGRDTVQIRPSEEKELDLVRVAEQLSPLGTVRVSPSFLRFDKDPYQLSVFPDGRVLVHGTSEPATARSLYAQYLGG